MGKALKPELPSPSPMGQQEQGTYSRFFPCSSLVLTPCQRVRATTSPGGHPEPSLVPTSLRERVQQARRLSCVNGPEQSQESVTAAATPKGECWCWEMREEAVGGGSRRAWDTRKLQWD